MQVVRIDKVKWLISGVTVKKAEALCPVHSQKIYVPDGFYELTSNLLVCEDCDKVFELPRTVDNEKRYVLDRIQSRLIKDMPVLNLDDEAIPIAEDKVSKKDNPYFVKAILTKSKTGLRLVIYAGKKGLDKKTQIFVEPEIKKLAFDPNDLHPNDVFTSVDATFDDGSNMNIRKK